ncbi:DUF4382 domain-containing protein [Salegentibacter salegens]|uniref:DUF4382 domain-containing protein n=1 Tax=Salegentibacter salegens TaxID=143223 RepID=A0A1M7KTC2_9FLAO|nr:DUF4382 domain-containing protein [Salegentibacter salegens]PRX43797.1 uncharacterized protein DUF4382 [Salegentibacter salegens]SHM68736.1 protein of unknown function [Salegentibacter salegens]
MLKKNLNKLALVLGVVLFASCSEDDSIDNPDNNTGEETSVYITDSPVDQANVEAVFITVSEVKLNGKAIEGFQKSTIEISSLTNGSTEMLGKLNLDAGTTSSIELVLADSDDDNNAPGNYLVTKSGTKQELSGVTQIQLNDQVEIKEDGPNDIVLDFDLRKSIKQEGDQYTFVSDGSLQKSLRAVNTSNVGVIEGNVENSSDANAETVIAYAYRKGEFNESEKDGDQGVRFNNAVSSSVVSESNGDFEIHFLEEGDYEMYFASYSDDDQDGKLEFSGLIRAEAIGGLNLNGVSVDANTTVNLEVTFKGILDL